MRLKAKKNNRCNFNCGINCTSTTPRNNETLKETLYNSVLKIEHRWAEGSVMKCFGLVLRTGDIL